MFVEPTFMRPRRSFGTLGGVAALALVLNMLSTAANGLTRPDTASATEIHCPLMSCALSRVPSAPVLVSGADVSVLSTRANVAQARGHAPEPTKRVAQDESLEVRFWNAIKDTDNAEDFRLYLRAHPDGKFAAQARTRLQQLEGSVGGTPDRSTASAQDTVRDCERCPALALIPAGSFAMGSTELFPVEGPVHQVTIRQAFYIGQREVTFGEWDACVAEKACAHSPNVQSVDRAALPVTNVDWNDAHEYVAWLTKKTGKIYRLPSESEWEYAARGGSATAYPWGKVMEKGRANCLACNPEPTGGAIATGSYPANGFGLYDVVGNAAEWVEDCWNDSYKSAPADGSAWTKPRCQERVLRGGAFNNDPRFLRSASRFKYDADVRYIANGFRVVREK
jgi:formylglycine-generating enzyme required for sulfatase activity